MRKIVITLLLFWIMNAMYSQTFSNDAKDKTHAVNCMIRIINDTTVEFMYATNKNETYGEYKGSLKKTNDTLYRVSLIQSIGFYPMKSWSRDTLFIQIDSTIAHQLDVIQVEFTNDSRVQYQGYDNQGKSIDLLSIPFDKNVFNDKKGSDFVTVSINRKNFEHNDFLSFYISYRSAAHITKGEALEFDIVIKKDVIYTTGTPPLQTGHFSLKKKK